MSYGQEYGFQKAQISNESKLNLSTTIFNLFTIFKQAYIFIIQYSSTNLTNSFLLQKLMYNTDIYQKCNQLHGPIKIPQNESQKQQYYIVQKVLDKKIQNNKKYYLVKWVGWPIQTATWQPHQNLCHLPNIINRYKQNKNDKFVNNLNINGEKITPGSNPYQETNRKGHLLYGDEPKCIVSFQKNINKQLDKKQLLIQIQWNARNDGFKPQNAIICLSQLSEYAPGWIFKQLQKKMHLI